jgi:hypothetical protein
MPEATYSVGVYHFKSLREATYVHGGSRLYGIPDANIGQYDFWTMGLNLSLIRDRHHVRKVNLVSGGFSALERSVIRMPEFKRDGLTWRHTRVQVQMEEAC